MAVCALLKNETKNKGGKMISNSKIPSKEYLAEENYTAFQRSEEEEKIIVNIHLESMKHLNSTHRDDKFIRGYNYFAYAPDAKINVLKISAVPVTIGSVSGAGIGALAGAGIGFACTGTPMGAGVGAIIGACSGSALGGISSTPYIVYKVSESPHYMRWQQLIKCVEVDKAFEKYIFDDPYLQEFKCPISKNTPNIPMKAPDGLIYDEEYIIQWINTNPMIKDPKDPSGVKKIPMSSVARIKHFEAYQLELHIPTMMKIESRIKQIVTSDLQLLLKAGVIAENLSKYIDARKHNANIVISAESEILREKLTSKKFTREQFIERNFELQDLYNEINKGTETE